MGGGYVIGRGKGGGEVEGRRERVKANWVKGNSLSRPFS